ncbi:MAG TPA: sulfatase-like hydrolase/transferase [Kofleriaceae bacterium]|jgi:arylsulfatase A-like enzyme
MPRARFRSWRDAAIGDVGRAIAMTFAGVVAFAPAEYAITLWAYPAHSDQAMQLRLAALVLTLSAWLWGFLVLALPVAMLAGRALATVLDRDAARAPSWFSASPLDERGVRPGVPMLWAVLATAAVVGFLLQRVAVWAFTHYKEPQLTGIVVALLGLVVVAAGRPLFRLLSRATHGAARALAPRLKLANPFGRWIAAGVLLAGLIAIGLAAMWIRLPQSRSVMPIRLIVSAGIVAFGMGIGSMLYDRRKPRARSRKHALIAAGAAFALIVPTLLWWGGDPEAKYAAITSSPALDKLVDLVRFTNDLDRDGFGSLLGENDCAPLDPKIHPGAVDIPDDGIDQNCDGHDFTLHAPAVATGPHLPVPPEFRKPWNFLFITVDTLRYDHTTFGGYAKAAKHRDTTPRLAELVKKSTSFTFCNAPSAGTMASIPSIITSKYFHDGIALDYTGVKPGMPPRLKPENVLLPEIMKRAGYYTGVIASHEYWNDWGMDQGVDDYDNTIGKTPDPFRVAADKSTDRALAWISRQQGKKWFLWVHYIDPHGRYVAHPDVVDYGSSEPDLYDAEIKWTDQQIGRLLDELQHLPSTPNTIIILTSDHGDSMAEHNVPLGTHGTALYFELQHVPMIFYIPDNRPHEIGGAVTNLDIVPTIAELAGIDVHDLSFEGISEVPAIFYGKEDHSRIVFAETNAPTPQRAAISEAYKLIYYMQSNLYELFDLKADPTEHNNLAPKRPPAFEMMKSALDAWLERVTYARNPEFNQADERFKDILLHGNVTPPVATANQTLDDGKLAVTGLGLADGVRLTPNSKADINVYFHVAHRTSEAYRFGLVAWPVDPATWKPTDPVPPDAMRTPPRVTAKGFFPTDRWRDGEDMREHIDVTIPGNWHAPAIAVGLVAVGQTGRAPATGDHPSNDADLLLLGTLPMGSSGSAAP